MARPFNILRCLHIWKPWDRAWGYDLIMATAMRVANGQPGCEPEELERFTHVLDRIGFPEWLDGTIDYDSDGAWQMYISETIENVFYFMLTVNKGLIVTYLVSFLVFAVVAQFCYGAGGFRTFASASLRVVFTHSLVVVATMWFMACFRNSEWAVGISSGNTLRRPFPNIDEVWTEDPSITSGLTVMPSRRDVLVGTRLASKTIGAYSRWLDFHPGNEAFLELVDDMTTLSSRTGGVSLYNSYEAGLPPIFHRLVLRNIVEEIEQYDGKFLQQDYRTGDWRLMSEGEALDYTRLMLKSGLHGASAEVKRGIDFQLGDYRFGMLRGTSLAWNSQLYLHHLTKLFFGTRPRDSPREHQHQKLVEVLMISSPLRWEISTIADEVHLSAVPTSKRWTNFPVTPLGGIRIGSNVLFNNKKGKIIPATVVDVNEDNESFEIAFSGDVADRLGRTGRSMVPRDALKKRLPAVEGARVQANYREYGEWFPGYISQVHPSGADIYYEDGDFEESVPLSSFFVVDESETESD